MKLNIGDLIRRAGKVITHPILQALGDFYVLPKSNKASQVMLSMQYKQMLALHLPQPTFEDIEFRAFSQYGEDGILLYIFSLIGTTNKQCVEVCGGGGIDNTANLIINHGWKGLFFDGSEKKIRNGQKFYARCLDTQLWPPKLVHTWITARNINALLQENGYVGEIDLLSLDMDGVDYWVWKAIECINPRVVVLEYNSALGADPAVTVPDKLDFTMKGNDVSLLRYRVEKVANMFLGKNIERMDHYFGASLLAFVKLGKEKGYRLVGCERYGFNAFFVRSGIGEEVFPEITPAECFEHPYSKYTMEVRGQNIVDKEWIEV